MTTYELRRPAATIAPPPRLDRDQQRVVDHPGGPLLVLAGPGTGKTTTLVEAIAGRIEAGAAADSVLALTFSRKAAESLRDRVTERLGGALTGGLSSTFHSFAYGLVRRYAPAELYAAPLRLLTAPEQDVIVQELLRETPESVPWPESLRAAAGTRGFAREVAAVLSRARDRGLDPADLTRLGRQEGIAAFVAAGAFMEQYLDVLDSQSALDYADLIHRAVIEAREHRDDLRARFQHVFVDEYQDTDPAQVDLLRALAGDGRNLVVVGDPDQSIYGFRGADVRGILDFPAEFPTAGGLPAPVVALGTTRRFGPRLLRASRTVAAGIGISGAIPAARWQEFREPRAADNAFGPGRVEVITFDTARAETDHIADLLRRAHLEDGVGWSEMAVLVRSGRSSIPGLRRSLAAAGVPVEVASDETPLVREPALLPLFEAISVLEGLPVEDPGEASYVATDRLQGLLTSPLGGLDATDLRALVRELRAAEPGLAAPDALRLCALDPDRLAGVTGEAGRRARRLAALLREARALLERGATVEEVLWALWDGTDWPRRLRAAAEGGSRLAHRDLDAVCALFDMAAKAEERRGHTDVRTFLDELRAQEIPADTLADRGVRGEAVRLLTAHRSKGLQWRLVVVARLQEGAWPDLRARNSLLGADRIGRDGLLPTPSRSTVLAEERRLFYVAVTRAQERLIVTAVKSPDDDGEQPSRFLGELGATEINHRIGRPVRPLSLAGLTADLRRTMCDPSAAPALRAAAARRLRRLAAVEVTGRPVALGADPSHWWGLRSPSRSSRPVSDPDAPVVISPSALAALVECPARWFLEREAGGSQLTSAQQGFGNLVHALAERVGTGELAAADHDALMALVDDVWHSLEFRTPWTGERERAACDLAVRRFLEWHAGNGRELVGVEADIDAVVALPDGEQVRVRGRADRLERDAAGRVVVVDLKTGKYPPAGNKVPQHPQLAAYQVAVEHGGADAHLPPEDRAVRGGAELVQLRVGDDIAPKVQHQGPDDPTEVLGQLAEAAGRVRREDFVARKCDSCDRCQFQPICPVWASGSVLS